MAKRKKKSQKELMEQYRISLVNVQEQPALKTTMTTFGYNAKEISQGQILYDIASSAFNLQSKEEDETTAAKGAYDEAQDMLDDKYRTDRKKAKIVFKNDDVVLKQLGLKGSIPNGFVDWVETMESLYNGIVADKNVQTKLARLKLTLKDAQTALVEIKKMKDARAEYYKEVGESEDATKQKDKAFSDLDEWMRELYSVAKIAMEDQPQLLEALGVFVKS